MIPALGLRLNCRRPRVRVCGISSSVTGVCTNNRNRSRWSPNSSFCHFIQCCWSNFYVSTWSARLNGEVVNLASWSSDFCSKKLFVRKDVPKHGDPKVSTMVKEAYVLPSRASAILQKIRLDWKYQFKSYHGYSRPAEQSELFLPLEIVIEAVWYLIKLWCRCFVENFFHRFKGLSPLFVHHCWFYFQHLQSISCWFWHRKLSSRSSCTSKRNRIESIFRF